MKALAFNEHGGLDKLRYQDVLWLAPELGAKGFAGMGTAAPMRCSRAFAETMHCLPKAACSNSSTCWHRDRRAATRRPPS